MPSTPPYKYLEVTGPVNVVRTSPRELQGQTLAIYILMGPTGSGKSAFIESLSDGTLSISKDTLESVTQEVACYKAVNLKYDFINDHQVIFMDTPGFLDTKLSESRITTMITATLEEIRQHAAQVWPRIIYFHPITDIRLGASKRDTARLLMAFAKSFGADGIAVATTMWNTVHRPMKMAEAQGRLVALQADIFKSSFGFGISVEKFEFSRESALLIMDNVVYGWFGPVSTSRSNLFRTMAHDNLLNRIRQAELQLQLLAEDRIQATTPGREDKKLLKTVVRSQNTVAATHASFLYDLYDLDASSYRSNFPDHPFPPPPPPPQHQSFITTLRQLKDRVPFKSVFK